MKEMNSHNTNQGRRWIVLTAMFVAMASLLVRAVHLQHYKRDFLQHEGELRHHRVMTIPAYRGTITDRHGTIMAVSTPVDSVWLEPKRAMPASGRLDALAKMLDIDERSVHRRLAENSEKSFIYLKRHVPPELAKRVMDLKLPGVHLQREYHRYYPMSEVSSHLLGFTDIDDKGQEGLELTFNNWLKGVPGEKHVIKDRKGRIVKDINENRAPNPGKDLRLSLDGRIQYLAYRELKAAINRQGARSGSIVVLDPHQGKVLAMVNQPSFNPNNRSNLRTRLIRNRAVTDLFEPGSTVKPFTVASAIENGWFNTETMIDTSPGWYMVRGHTIQDEHNYGKIKLSRVIVKSSNVGAAKIALAIPPKQLWDTYRQVGFGENTGSGFPGEAAGMLSDFSGWNKIERATLAFGYGLSVTPLQLAQAYSVLANDGFKTSISYLDSGEPQSRRRVMSDETCRKIRKMLEGVVSSEGTAKLAKVEGYRVAGKTGTVHKTVAGGYAKDRYISVFAGMAPASSPRLVMVVMIDEPSRGEYFGGVVAAPVFSRVMAGALRLLDVPPDDLPTLQAKAKVRAESA
jgi:cell division protein FtsI (penicillin-binding protein 3)